MTSSTTRPDRTPAALARAAAETIRDLSHATRGDGLASPAAASDVLGALTMAAGRTHRVLSQIDAYLRAQDTAGHLGHDLGHDPASAVSAASGHLADAALSALELASDLAAARQTLVFVNNLPRLFSTEQP